MKIFFFNEGVELTQIDTSKEGQGQLVNSTGPDLAYRLIRLSVKQLWESDSTYLSTSFT